MHSKRRTIAKPRRLSKAVLFLSRRNPRAHKGDFGRVLIVAGSSEYVGAAVLATTAALAVLKTGVDLVTVAAPEEVSLILNCITPSIIAVKLPGTHLQPRHLRRIFSLTKKADVLLIGPGIGSKSDAAIRTLCIKFRGWKVIDADAIKALGGKWRKRVRNAIFTPHTKEFQLLTGKRPPKNLSASTKLVQQQAGNNIILLKGHTDIIATKVAVCYNTAGNPTMTKGGTGDVLAGFCAGFLARTKDPFHAACMAAYLNGAVGDSLAKRYGSTYRTEDIIQNIHTVWRIP